MKNKLIKKLACILILSIALLSVFAACGDNSQKNKNYVVTFNSMGGSEVSSVSLKAGEALKEPVSPTRNYFNFLWWSADPSCEAKYIFGVMPSQDITLYAKWSPLSSFEISFDSMGGTEVKSIIDIAGASITTPVAPLKHGYVFAGWYTDKDYTIEYTFSKIGDSDITLYAKWVDANEFVYITYIVNDVETRVPHLVGFPIAPPTGLYGSDCEIEGWFTDKQQKQVYNPLQIVAGDLTLYTSPYTKGLQISNNAVTGFTGSSLQVVIPNYYKGIRLTKINDNAFYGNKNIKEVIFPTAIVEIGANAFFRCEQLKTAILPAITKLGVNAFYRCERLESIGALSGNIAEIPSGAFTGCHKLKDFEISSNRLTSIGEYAFADCERLENIVLPDTVTTIGNFAFTNCTKLQSINMSDKLQALGDSAFNNCYSLKNLTVDGNNSKYTTIDGNLYNKSGTVLYLYVAGDKQDADFSHPGTLRLIKENAFMGNSNILNLELGSNIEVECGGLRGMKNLESITLSDFDAGYLGYYFGQTERENNAVVNTFVPRSLEKVVFTDDISAVGDYAFIGITGLKAIDGIENASVFGEYCFAYTGFEAFNINGNIDDLSSTVFLGCEKLREFTISNDNTAYSVYDGCLYSKNMSELIYVPNGKNAVTISADALVIRSGAFSGSIISEIVIPSNITEIGIGAFKDCYTIEKMTIPFVGESASASNASNVDGKNNTFHHIFGGEKIVTYDSKNVRKVGISGLDYVPFSLKMVVITGNTNLIAEYAFAACDGLVDIIYPSSVTELGQFAFQGIGISNLVLPENVLKVGKGAFINCARMITAYIHGNANLQDMVLANCLNLTSVEFGEGISELPDYTCAPYSEVGATGETVYYSSLSKIVIPSTVTRIGKYSFAYAGVMQNVAKACDVTINDLINSKLEEIDVIAFTGCALSEIKLPATLKVVRAEAFSMCLRLTSVQIGNKVQGSALESLEMLSFANNSNLMRFDLYKTVSSAQDVPTMEIYEQKNTKYYAFYYCNESFSVYVPAASVEYFSAVEGWKEYQIGIKAD